MLAAKRDDTICKSFTSWWWNSFCKGDTIRQKLGIALAAIGAILSVLGVICNNIFLQHELAMLIWMPSNVILFIWAVGHGRRWWDGGISIDVLVIMYAVFALTNWYGIWFAS